MKYCNRCHYPIIMMAMIMMPLVVRFLAIVNILYCWCSHSDNLLVAMTIHWHNFQKAIFRIQNDKAEAAAAAITTHTYQHISYGILTNDGLSSGMHEMVLREREIRLRCRHWCRYYKHINFENGMRSYSRKQLFSLILDSAQLKHTQKKTAV